MPRWQAGRGSAEALKTAGRKHKSSTWQGRSQRPPQAAQAAESAVAEAEKRSKSTFSRFAGKGEGAGSAACKLTAVTDVMDAIKARTANNANQAAAEATKVVNADDSAVKTVSMLLPQTAALKPKRRPKGRGSHQEGSRSNGYRQRCGQQDTCDRSSVRVAGSTLPQSSIAAESPPAAAPNPRHLATSISTLGAR